MPLSGRAAGGTAVRVPSRRRWVIAGAVVVGLVVLTLVGLFVIYPAVGARMIREKLTAKLGARLGREIAIGAIEVKLGHAVVRDLEVRGPHDGGTPLVHVDRIDIEFDAVKSLVGSVRLGAAKVDGVTVAVHRDAEGNDNVRDVVDRLTGKAGSDAEGEGGASLRPTELTVARIKVTADDSRTGAKLAIADGDATWKSGELVGRAHGITATTIDAPQASASLVTVTKRSGQPPVIAIEGGEITVWPKLSLTGIGGSIVANPQTAGQYTLDLAGGYGGVPGKLWTAKGVIVPAAQTASVDLVADKFQLDRLAPLLAKSAVVDYAQTSVDTKLHVEVAQGGMGTFSGTLDVSGLNVGHPMIADKEVHDLDLSAQVAGTFDRMKHQVTLTRGDFTSRNVPFSVTGTATLLDKAGYDKIAAVDPKLLKDFKNNYPRRGPGGLATLALRFVIPKTECQRVLDGIPPEMAPYMQGYKLKGTFSTDISVGIDWANLDATTLGGSVGIRGCRVTEEPEDSPKRLTEEFEHFVELDENEWLQFIVGPSSEDFVPLDQISPYLIKSIMSTEDSAFYQHHGFIVSEFRTALVNNLKAGKFRYGASSITMQFVKNVLLYREKTLLRKLQELFLTWHVENTLTKDRILEIYFNVIEYGPALYGIGPASWHFFSKPAKDLNPVEAAFFSSILPAPKDRYKQYCQGTLTKWTEDKIKRILGVMLKRKRLTQEEYDQALATPLLFAKDDSESEKDCLQRTKKAITNARSTNPMKAKDAQEPEKTDRKKTRDDKKEKDRDKDVIP
ncbi:MAG: transglycosylase domain-containing protein [Kofleriaceae bacterium]|nr:transglycosylase domain-containing protein [Kofleriaceae bacterium]